MTHRRRVFGALTLAAIACGAADSEPTKPNLIFVLADDLGYGDVGFNGQQHIRTPNLDRMAREGLVLTDHYAGSTVCMPSRCSLLTGKHTGHSTVRGNPKWTASGKPVDLRPSDVTVAQELQRAGYRTAIIGKWGLAEADDRAMPLLKGFGHFYGYRRHGSAHHYYPERLWRGGEAFEIPGNDSESKRGTYSHDMLIDEALEFIRSERRGPFFLFLALTVPHLEITVPDDSKAQYRDLGWPRREMRTDGHYKNDPEGNVAYAGMVSRMDRDLGRIRGLLDSLGIARNTLLIFTSDNGPQYENRDRFFNSNGPLRGGKRDLYEGGIRVPWVAVWPDEIAPGRRSEHVSAFWDFLPTVCEIAGTEPSDPTIDGVSFLPTLRGEPSDQSRHEYLYWEFNEHGGPAQAVRFGQWKAVRLHRRRDVTVELYDLAADIGESRDVADRRPEIVAQALRFFEDGRTDTPDFPLTARRSGNRRRATAID